MLEIFKKEKNYPSGNPFTYKSSDETCLKLKDVLNTPIYMQTTSSVP